MCSLSLLCVRRLNFLLLQPVRKSDSIQFRPRHTEVNQSNVVKIPNVQVHYSKHLRVKVQKILCSTRNTHALHIRLNHTEPRDEFGSSQ